MTFELILRYIHFISVFTIVSTILSEHLLLKKEMTPAELKRISRIDMVYGIAVITLMIAGFTLWLGAIGKPTDFYSNNWIFILKLVLFTIIGILSIYPTVFFIRGSKKQQELVPIPKIITMMIRMELLILFIIPILAGMMAKGIGLNID